MADPFSIIAGVLGITAAVIQSSKIFLELVNDIRRCPEEVKSVSKDVHAFYAIISSLNVTLREVDVKDAIAYDDALLTTIGNLAHPLEHCRVILGELKVKIQQQLLPFPNDRRFRINSKILRWSLFTKSEIRTLQRRLEATKTTLCIALDAITAIHLLGKVATSQLVKRTNEPVEARFPISRLFEDPSIHNSKTEISRRAFQGSLLLELDTDIAEASTLPNRQIFWRITSWIQETQHAFMLEDPSIRRHLAQIYQELGEQRMELSEIRLLNESSKEPKNSPIVESSNSINLFGEPVNTTLDQANAEDNDSASVDILRAKFSGSPGYHFELRPSFYPEQYSTESLFNKKIFTLALRKLTGVHRTQQYFLLYAETPRKWQRIVISATFDDFQENSAVFQLSDTDDCDDSCKLLPKALQAFFDTLLPALELFNSVSSISLHIKDLSGQIFTESSAIRVTEDLLEKEMSKEDQILQDIDAMGIRKFLESRVIMKSRISSSCYRVLVDNREFIERKTPFARAGKQGENGFEDFSRALKLLNSLRGCASVVQLIGVVLDDTRRYLKGYLYESPAIFSLRRIIALANFRSKAISWQIREIWSSQIFKAVSEVHRKGVALGVLKLKTIDLRADGTAILTLRTSYRYLQNRNGTMPPELRNDPQITDGIQPTMVNFRTDVFQLGLVLWLLAEHKPEVIGCLCPRSGCTKFPRILCDAEHVNPVELPPCHGDIPPFFNDIIRGYRSPDPGARLTALLITKDLLYTSEIPPNMIDLLDTYAPEVNFFLPICDECGALTRNLRYYCNVCRQGDSDLCPECVELRGIHCFNSEHRLLKYVFEKVEYVDRS
ncbi:hypothetical protein EPUS_09411 [Endocarpon pusillum Z07020]|uniref:Azaphilone pigments biosynthesis cluster protein L N-terminal domain-containing protein n=1 Tax=Endocarpon pusillum (strain Z07020 / HMAS-L-300199) TaxID=1263415 RepID=U1HGU0_ENDPU|nr:uncharacterized protein EPUS_09411 [Endocarpon pusillum Z07020]ERF68059.1 hypothetical protein EPUS_09411 [Endocarpon pusillum Z07020]